MKKNKLISLTAAVAVSFGLIGTISSANQPVEAAKVYFYKGGEKIKFVRQPKVYDLTGSEVSSTRLKQRGLRLRKGETIRDWSVRKIHGQNYICIGMNLYVKPNEVVLASKKTPVTRISKNTYVYNAKGKRVGRHALQLGKRVSLLGTKKIKGKSYVRIGKNRYVRTNALPSMFTVRAK